jgi:hypothetical protein
MPDSEEMTIGERYKYLRKMERRYREGGKSRRAELLSEMEEVTGLHRKSLVRRMSPGGLVRRPAKKRRGVEYGADLDDVLRAVWASLDGICAERVTPALLSTAQLLVVHGEIAVLSPQVEEQLARISIASVQRRLRRFSLDTPKLPRKGPERANQLTREIPMSRISWETTEPGHFEVDLVHHSGPATIGEYVHTLQMVDVATGWSERVALLGRSQREMESGFRRMLARLPFPVLEVHPDNGSEFLNDHIVRFWKEKAPGLQLSRSRPYEKNDNRIVEQKNATLVRAYLGKKRLDTRAAAEALDELYGRMWLYYNVFQPVLRLAEKTVVGPRVRRKWDKARTPAERVLASEVLAADQRGALQTLRRTTNPRALRDEIYARLDTILFLETAGAQTPTQDAA